MGGCAQEPEVTTCRLQPISSALSSVPSNQIIKDNQGYKIRDMLYYDEHIFIELQEGLAVFDVKNPENPNYLGIYLDWDIPIIVNSTVAYSFWDDESHILDISNPQTLVEFDCPEKINFALTKNTQFSDDFAFEPKGPEGLKIFDITELANPEEIAQYQSHSIPELYWHKPYGKLFPEPSIIASEPMLALDIAVNDQYAYLGEGLVGIDSLYGGQFTILNVSNPKRPRRITVFPMPDNGAAQKVLLNEKVVYVSSSDPYGSQYTIALDVSTPSKPTKIATFPTGSLLAIHENFIYFNDYGKEVVVWDITNPKSPTFIGTIKLPPIRFGEQLRVTNIQFDNDLAYIVIEYAVLHIVDISNPKNAKILSSIQIP